MTRTNKIKRRLACGGKMIKVLYLLAGVLVKQLIDEIKVLAAQHVEELKKYREAIATYRPVPALVAGSPGALRAIAEAEHEARVGPEVHRLDRRIRVYRLIPAAMYALLTAGVLVWIIILEFQAE
jgi:hypothetical protein